MKKKIPEFTTDDDAEVFVKTADLTQYDLSGFNRTQFEFQAKAAQLNMRLPRALLDAVKKRAERQGIPYTRLVREVLEAAVSDRDRNKDFTLAALSIGNLQLTVESQLVLVAGRSVSLTSKERTTLELLLLRRNMVVTKEALLNYLYNTEDQPDTRLVDVFVSHLRKKLADAGMPAVIRTVWGRGYIIKDEISNASGVGEHVVTHDVSRRSRYRDAS